MGEILLRNTSIALSTVTFIRYSGCERAMLFWRLWKQAVLICCENLRNAFRKALLRLRGWHDAWEMLNVFWFFYGGHLMILSVLPAQKSWNISQVWNCGWTSFKDCVARLTFP